MSLVHPPPHTPTRTPTVPVPVPSSRRTSLADRGITLRGAVSAGLNAATPNMVIGVAVPVILGLSGFTAVPIAFAVVAVLLFALSTGLIDMARRTPNAGAFYSLVARGLGRVPGTAAGLVQLLAYGLLFVALLGPAGALPLGSPDQPGPAAGIGWAWPVWALIVLAVFTAVSLWHVKVISVVFQVIIVLEVLFWAVTTLVAFGVAVFGDGPAGGGGIAWGTLNPGALFTAGVIGLFILGGSGFIGFEAPTIFAEEAQDRARTVRVGMFAVLATAAVIYVVGQLAVSSYYGQANLQAVAQQAGPGMYFGITATHLGSWWGTAGEYLLIAAVASGIGAFLNATARTVFALAREGILPHGLAVTARHSGAPRRAILLVAAGGAVTVVAAGVYRWDPMNVLFARAGMIGTYALMLVLVAVAAAVAVYFARARRHPTNVEDSPATQNPVTGVVLPGLVAVILAWGAWQAGLDIEALLGLPEGDPTARLLLLLILAVAAIGVARSVYLRTFRRRRYDQIGLGPAAQMTGGRP